MSKTENKRKMPFFWLMIIIVAFLVLIISVIMNWSKGIVSMLFWFFIVMSILGIIGLVIFISSIRN